MKVCFGIAVFLLYPVTWLSMLLGGWGLALAPMAIFGSHLLLDNFGPRTQRDFSAMTPGTADLLPYAHLPCGVLTLTLLVWQSQPGQDLLGIGGLLAPMLGDWVLQAHRAIDGWQQAGCAYVAGLMLSTNHIVGHELVHRRSSRLAMLAGRWLLAGNGDAQFSVSHVYGHHMNVGTPADPATARRGENVYAFALRSACGQYVEALELEHRRLQRLGHGFWNPRNAVFTGLLMSLVLVVVAAVLGGVAGVAMLLGSMLTAKFLFEIVNYIQHYGIVRVPGARVDPRHSWDSDHLWATFTFYCLSRHSHHHAKPVLPYWALQSCGPDESGPGIRHGYIASMLIACVPPWWRRYMAPALAHWDAVLATPEELQLITHPTRRADRHAQPKGATP